MACSGHFPPLRYMQLCGCRKGGAYHAGAAKGLENSVGEEGDMKLALGAALALILGVGQASATVYSLTFPSSTDISGTITTDGDTGILSASDITSWHIVDTSSNAHFQFTLKQLNSTVSLAGSALTATTTQLLFDFSSITDSLLNFSSPNFFGGSGGYSVQLCDATGTCLNQNLSPDHSVILVVFIAPGCCSGGAPTLESGVTQIAAAGLPPVPEPSTWAMMLVGFASLGFLACSRRKRAAAAVAAA
jgi:hypothetical protein